MRKIMLLVAFLSFIGMQAFAQTTITGTVTDTNGEPVPGATVSAKGFSNVGTMTDLNGNYSLSVPADATTLIFSFVGMKRKEVEIGGQTTINVTMENEDVGLDEVIVTGYAVRSKNSLTGSTVQVDAEQLKDIPVVSVDQTLQGKVAGLTISTSSGTPGAIQDIRIRGAGSLTAGNDPLIVIDGVPVINDNFSGSDNRSSLSALSAINSNDIQSITVLKDASATSAYGARGSNGVIVITTKKGKNNKTSFNLSTYYGFQNKAINGRNVITGAQREELFLEAIYNTYGDAYGFTKDQTYDWASANGFTGDLDSWIAQGRPENDWEKAMTNENAPTYNVNFSATGGDKVSSFYASVGYNKTEAIVKGSSFQRINGSLNYNRKFGERINFSTTNTVSNVYQDGIILEQSAYFANPLLAKYFYSPWLSPYNSDGTPNIDSITFFNYLYLKDHDVNTNNMTRIMSNSYVEWEIIDNLKFKSLVGMDVTFTDYKSYANRVHGDSEGQNGSAETSNIRNFNIVYQNSLSYNMNFNDHNISILGLIEYQKNNRYYWYGYGENFSTDGLTNISSAGANWDASSSYTDWMNASYLTMINYEFSNKYVADFTYRREGSSRFAPGKRFGNFWSAGVAWNIVNEDFLDVSWLSNLRLRASYGVSGNSSIDINSYQALLAFDADYAGFGAVYPTGYGNNDLTWEKNKNYDVGIDFGFINNKISGSLAYFNKTTFDLLQEVPLSRTLGHSSILQNVGEVVNKGFEAIVNFNIVQKQDFNINISLNFASLDNEVTKLAKDGEGNDINIETGTRKIEVGHPIYEWYMRTYAGVNPDNGAAQWYLNGTDGEVTEDYYEAELAFQGKSAIPTYSGGGNLHVDYKGVYLEANFYFAGGNKIYEDWSFYTHNTGAYSIDYLTGVEELMNRWQKPGDITDVPRMEYSWSSNASRTSSRFLYDGDYIRMKDLVLGYNLPKSIVSKVKFQGISVYVRGTNLFTWVKDDRLKYDPEVRADGFTRLTNPPVKSITFGLNLNF
jgi:TonB-linked SusC/RagA family outer membrane protein